MSSNGPEEGFAHGVRYEELLYRNQVPEFALDLLCKLYGSLYSIQPAVQAISNNDYQGIFTYVRRISAPAPDSSDILLMFRLKDRSVYVLNEGMQLDLLRIEAFCSYVFAQMPNITQIDFHAIAPVAPVAPTAHVSAHGTLHAARHRLSWPCTEDIVIDLPESPEVYLKQLGKATRKSIRKQLSRALRELPDFSHQIISGTRVDDALVSQIINFNHARMAQQGRISALDEKAQSDLICLLRLRGEAGVIVGGGKLCAGTLACRVGDDLYSLVNAHDPTFDYLGLGNVCRHLMILEAIKAGARRFHLMGGNLPAKRATLAVRQPRHHMSVYRKRWHMLMDIRGIMRHAAIAALYQLQSTVEDHQAAAPDGLISYLVSTLRLLMRRRSAPPHTPITRAP